jgi:hypothetical protein
MIGIVQLSVRPPMAIFGTMIGVPIVMRRADCFALSVLLTVARLTVPLWLVLPLLRALTIPTLL